VQRPPHWNGLCPSRGACRQGATGGPCLVRQLERCRVERILTERPQFLCERPSVGLDEGHARIASQSQQKSTKSSSHSAHVPHVTSCNDGAAWASVRE
jgi:hypothetical protein